MHIRQYNLQQRKGQAMEAWSVISENVIVYNEWRKLKNVTYRLPNGCTKEYSLKDEGQVVSILALTAEKSVVLARQFRPGPGKMLDELPGGRVEAGESAEEAALRELLEETGYKPKHLEYLGRFYECAYSTIERHGFVATDCSREARQQLDDSEFITVVQKPINAFVNQLVLGLCTDSEVAWAALFKLALIPSETYLPGADNPCKP